jgi:predicted ATPase
MQIQLGLQFDSEELVYGAKLIAVPGDRLLIAGESIRTPNDVAATWGSALEESRYAQDARYGRGDGVAVFRFFERCHTYHFHDTTDEARIRKYGDIDDNRVLHGNGRNLAAFLYKLQETRPEYLQLIARHVRLVAPYFDRFVLAPNALNPRTILLRWKEHGRAEDFGVHVLSDGTLRFIAIAALLLQPPDDLPPVLVIDEPELGLHPYAVTMLASLLRRASHHCQIIVATQSPGLLDHFEPEDVIVVDRVNGATEFHRHSPEQLSEWLEEYTLSELWYKNVLGGSPSR